MIILWTIASFVSGSLMFSYALGRIARRDLKEVGDGNPGGLNLWRAAGMPLGIAGIALDFLKGYVPVLLFLRANDDYASSYAMVPVALAPVLGHAFSPFLKGRGGKAIAVTFGVWSALTGFEASIAYAVVLAIAMALDRSLRRRTAASPQSDALQVVSGMLPMAGYLALRGYPGSVLLFWLANFLLMAYTHRRELRRVIPFLHEAEKRKGREL
ncbi:glycerol-3-phosphate acyltransferase [Cohnella nanjingensis]|uniref:Glycerol-3-phosphate acyltransferase n=1 Tax=Cohnella nanjingensis TaxID=1387779 RepID=A0A7X0RTR0_9BACL|nr:glycerol-3-phosphate acyltransferase [Cohnella nanjingensis]MBB6673548.1 glycerol-3-phosphate acyltransferase [Cohnella nanjingensis]